MSDPRIMLRCSFPTLSFTLLLLAGCQTMETGEPAAIDAPTFAIADTNDDGKLSRTELAHHKHKEALAEFDLNNDGMISSSEWSSAKPSAGEQDEHFNQLDKDGNGQVTQEEAVLFVSEHVSFSDMFEELDKNDDNHLHWEEFAEAEPDSVNVTLFSIRH